ncbi:MAG TPA: universal stress protein [Gemmatimonadaceae bacterium]|jgi:nucleotide-binding universal stress UspA family protein
MYRKLMVPTDGSGFDRKAILVALRIAERCKAKVVLVRVLTTRAYLETGTSGDRTASVKGADGEYRAALSELDRLAVECGNISSAQVSTALEEGPAADVLERYARRNEIDLIVISSHSRHGFARASLGSVADSLIRGTTIPVLVAKPNASYLTPQAAGGFRHIIVPLDGSGLAERILAQVVPLAKAEEAEVTLLHVLGPTDDPCESDDRRGVAWWEKRVAGINAYLTHRAHEIRQQGVAVAIDVVVGEKVADAIIEYGRREDADLIAIATHGRGGLARVARGSVADDVLRSAMCSVLVFHPDRGNRSPALENVSRKSCEDATAFA